MSGGDVGQAEDPIDVRPIDAGLDLAHDLLEHRNACAALGVVEDWGSWQRSDTDFPELHL